MGGQWRREGQCMTDAAVPGDDRARGESSRRGFAESDQPHPAQDKAGTPNLASPAEEEQNPPTHPGQTGGLGEGGRAPDQQVPSGDPKTESDRTDLQ